MSCYLTRELWFLRKCGHMFILGILIMDKNFMLPSKEICRDWPLKAMTMQKQIRVCLSGRSPNPGPRPWRTFYQRETSFRYRGLFSLGSKKRPAFCFLLSRCWQYWPPHSTLPTFPTPHPRIVSREQFRFTKNKNKIYLENKMSQPAKQSYLGLLNILVKFSIANPALVWLVLGS